MGPSLCSFVYMCFLKGFCWRYMVSGFIVGPPRNEGLLQYWFWPHGAVFPTGSQDEAWIIPILAPSISCKRFYWIGTFLNNLNVFLSFMISFFIFLKMWKCNKRPKETGFLPWEEVTVGRNPHPVRLLQLTESNFRLLEGRFVERTFWV